MSLAWRLQAHLGRMGQYLDAQQCYWLWVDKVLYHEYFHHLVDAALTAVELKHRVPLFPERIRRYHSHVTHGRSVEEALANAFAFERLARHQTGGPGWWREPDFLVAMADAMRRQPPGYRDFERYLMPLSRVGGLQALAEACIGEPDAGLRQEFIFNLYKERLATRRTLRDLPLYLVDRLR